MGRQLLCWCFIICLIGECVPASYAVYAPDKSIRNQSQSVTITCKNVDKSGEFHDAVVEMIRDNLTNWANGTDFKPTNTVTRNEFYLAVYRKYKKELSDSTSASDDDKSKTELDRAIELFRKKGWFGPNEAYGNGKSPIERGEVIGFLFWLYKKLYRERNKVNFNTVYEVEGFSDVHVKDSYAQAVMWAVSSLETLTPGYYDGKVQLASGYSDGTFRPTGKKGRVNRKQIALFLLRFSNLSCAK